jgi:hypothetical protein
MEVGVGWLEKILLGKPGITCSYDDFYCQLSAGVSIRCRGSINVCDHWFPHSNHSISVLPPSAERKMIFDGDVFVVCAFA